MKNFDKQFYKNNNSIIAGTDEAGRGPLAGPVVAAAVILPADFYDERINDSKQLNEAMREELFEVIKKSSVSYTYTVVNNKKIDEINILNASLLAMRRSVEKLKVKPDIVLVDGNKIFNYGATVIPIVKGDSKSLTIASASIIAKVIRDRIMVKLSSLYPEYGWKKNKGYPTKFHINAILQSGACVMHRKTFLKNIYDRNLQSTLNF